MYTKVNNDLLQVGVLSWLLAQTWNTLPEDVASSQSEYIFHHQL